MGSTGPAAPAPPDTVRRLAGDVRVILAATGYVLLLQVAHPTVAAGVRDHSTYRDDPFGRYFRSLDYLWLLTYGRPDQVDRLGRALRDLHRPIRGTDPQGRRYSALEPRAYAWVHATTAEGVLRGHDTVGVRLTPSDREAYWAQWRDLGLRIGVRPDDLPETWDGLQEYVATTIAERLEHNDVVRDLLIASRAPSGPSPLPGLVPPWLLTLSARPSGHVARLLSFGMMPAPLREKLQIPWSPRRDRAFRVTAAAHRAATPVLPHRLRHIGPTLLRLRHEALATGPFAPALDEAITAQSTASGSGDARVSPS